MSDPRNANRRALHDHASPMGSPVAWTFTIKVFGLDGQVDHVLAIAIHVSNQMSVSAQSRPTGDPTQLGLLAQPALMRAMLDNAKDAVRAFHFRSDVGALSIPGRDVSLPVGPVSKVTIEGPIHNREYTIAVLDAVAAGIKDDDESSRRHASENAPTIQM